MDLERLKEECPEHDRTSCSDEHPINNGVDLRYGHTWCRRCEGLHWIKTAKEREEFIEEIRVLRLRLAPKVESAHFLAVTNTESFDKDRTNFESWAITLGLSVDGTCYQDKRMYGDSDTHYAWEAWKAAIASRPAVEPAQADIAAQDEEIAALRAELDECDALREKLASLLARTAVALKGPEAALHRHGWQDLDVVALAAMLEIEMHKQAKEADIEALRADAARYRWLRSQELNNPSIFIGVDTEIFSNRWALGAGDEALADKEIDKARAAQQTPGKKGGAG